MRTRVYWLVVVLTLFAAFLVGCASDADDQLSQDSPSALQEDSEPEVGKEEEADKEEEENIDLGSLSQGDPVSLVGICASNGLAADNTLWVDVTSEGGRTVVYHCGMKAGFEEEVAGLSMLEPVKVQGYFLNFYDLSEAYEAPEGMEYAITVTLYDCEIVE